MLLPLKIKFNKNRSEGTPAWRIGRYCSCNDPVMQDSGFYVTFSINTMPGYVETITTTAPYKTPPDTRDYNLNN